MGREHGQLLQGNLSTLLINILKTGVSLVEMWDGREHGQLHHGNLSILLINILKTRVFG